MAISSSIAIYFVLWWVVLFAVLPFGVRSQAEDGATVPGSDPGAPTMHRMMWKLIWTTIISAILFAVGIAAHNAGYLNLERLSRLLGFPH